MESTAPPPPPPPPPGQAPPPPPPRARASAGLRALAVLLALVLAFGAAVMIVAMVDINDTPTCADVRSGKAQPREGHCFDGGKTQRLITVVIGFAGGAVGAVAALLALVFTFTGRRGRVVLLLTALAVVLSGLSILIGSV
jgi:hypothetical protein